jgi:hypothetical protein
MFVLFELVWNKNLYKVKAEFQPTDFIILFIGTPLSASEDVDADRQLWVPNILMLIPALAMSCFT